MAIPATKPRSINKTRPEIQVRLQRSLSGKVHRIIDSRSDGTSTPDVQETSSVYNISAASIFPSIHGRCGGSATMKALYAISNKLSVARSASFP